MISGDLEFGKTELGHVLTMKYCNDLERDGSLQNLGTTYYSCLGFFPLVSTTLIALTQSLSCLANFYYCVLAYSYWMDKEDEDKVD